MMNDNSMFKFNVGGNVILEEGWYLPEYWVDGDYFDDKIPVKFRHNIPVFQGSRREDPDISELGEWFQENNIDPGKYDLLEFYWLPSGAIVINASLQDKDSAVLFKLRWM